MGDYSMTGDPSHINGLIASGIFMVGIILTGLGMYVGIQNIQTTFNLILETKTVEAMLTMIPYGGLILFGIMISVLTPLNYFSSKPQPEPSRVKIYSGDSDYA